MNDDDVQLQPIEEEPQTLDVYLGSPYDEGCSCTFQIF